MGQQLVSLTSDQNRVESSGQTNLAELRHPASGGAGQREERRETAASPAVNTATRVKERDRGVRGVIRHTQAPHSHLTCPKTSTLVDISEKSVSNNVAAQ